MALKKDRSFLTSVWCLSFVISCIIVYFGAITIKSQLEYLLEATEEKCLVISRSSPNGVYHDDNCKEYSYQATVVDKCDERVLNSAGSDCQTRNIGDEYKCYVLDCEDAEFAFHRNSGAIVWGILLVLFGVVLSVFVSCLIVLFRQQ